MSRRQAPGLASPRPAAIVVLPVTHDGRPEGGRAAGATSASAVRLVAAYARVSSDRQEREQTIDSQIDALRRAAEERGWMLPPELVCTDDGRSGATLARPGLDRLRDLVAEGHCAAVLVCSPDRLARNYAYQVLVVDELKRAGCEAVFLNHAFDGSPEQQMLLQMQGVFAEYERALITERTRRGRLFWARQGRVNWGGTPTYGYRLLRGTENGPRQLAVEGCEAAVVRQMYRWLVEEQLSSYAIQKRLIERGIPTRKGGGRGWAQSMVIRILSNSAYKGEAWYNQRCPVDGTHPPRPAAGPTRAGSGKRRRQVLRPAEEWIAVSVPAIIDPDTWRLAQQQLARNRQQAKRNNTRHAYLLSALLTCVRCGRRMIGAADGRGVRRYVCSARYPRHACGACDGHSVTAAHVEAQVWRWTAGLLSGPALLRARFEESRGDPAAADDAGEREGTRIERQLTVLEREVERLIDAYQAAAITLPELQERRQQVEDRVRHLQARSGELRQQRSARAQELRLLQGLEAFCEGIRDALIDPPFETKQRVLRLVIDRIVVEQDRLVVRHVVPTAPIGLQPRSLGDDPPRLVPEAGQQPLEEALRGRGVPAVLHQDVEHDAVLVHRPPEVMQLAVDADEHLIEVPGVTRLRPSPAQLPGEVAAELQAPLPDALVGDDHAPLGQDQLDIAQAEAEHVVQPDGVADDLGREAVPGVAGGVWRHPASLAQPLRSGHGPST